MSPYMSPHAMQLQHAGQLARLTNCNDLAASLDDRLIVEMLLDREDGPDSATVSATVSTDESRRIIVQDFRASTDLSEDETNRAVDALTDSFRKL